MVLTKENVKQWKDSILWWVKNSAAVSLVTSIKKNTHITLPVFLTTEKWNQIRELLGEFYDKLSEMIHSLFFKYFPKKTLF